MADENIVDQVVDTKVVQPAVEPAVTTGDDTPVTTVADTVKTEPKAADERPAPADWPSDWREKAAGGDAKKAARLSTYASPQALAEALIAAQNRIAAGDLKPTLGANAKPEEVAAFRAAHGIPETPDKYDLSGYEVPDEEKPLIDMFLKSAHELNMIPEHVKGSLEAYARISEHARNERLAEDDRIKTEVEDKLRAEWGNEYRVNLNLMENLLSGAPEGLRDKLMHGRLADGTPIGSSPEMLNFLVNLERERNPAGVVTPGSATTTAQSVADELAAISKFRNENRPAYNKDQKMQERERALINWQLQQKQRAA